MDAIIMQVTEALESNIALMYKSVFIGETSCILKKMGYNVKICDTIIENYTLKEISKLFCLCPELLVFIADVQQARLTKRVAELCKLCCPTCKIIVIGRATSFIPQYFARKPFDAVHIKGDREAAIINYVKFLHNKIRKDDLANLCIIENKEIYISSKTQWLNSKDWSTPDLSDMNIEAYKKFNQKQNPNKKLILGITSMKGCPYGCEYCGASTEEGLSIRYGNVNNIINWANSNTLDAIIQLWAPNILCNEKWLKKYINIYEKTNSNFSWRGVARLESINEEKIKTIYNHNCKEISIGIEMIKQSTHLSLKGNEIKIYEAIELFSKYKINLKCLLMLGYPGYDINDVIYTINLLNKNDIKYRITGYTPLQNLKTMTAYELDNMMLENYDRRFYYNNCQIDSNLYYKILSTNGECLL